MYRGIAIECLTKNIPILRSAVSPNFYVWRRFESLRFITTIHVVSLVRCAASEKVSVTNTIVSKENLSITVTLSSTSRVSWVCFANRFN